jgi:ATP-dependent Lon protease
MRIPLEVPVMTLPGVILFPQSMLPLHIFEPRYRVMLRRVLESDRMFAVAMKRPGRTPDTPFSVAGLGLVRVCVRNRDGTANLVLQGVKRVKLQRVVHYRPYRVYRVVPLDASVTDSGTVETLTSQVLDLVSERLKLGFQLPLHLMKHLAPAFQVTAPVAVAPCSFQDAVKGLLKLNDPEQLTDLISCALLPTAEERQAILETVDLESRLRQLIQFLMLEIQRQRKKTP